MKRLLTTTALAALLTVPANAGGIPVFDAIADVWHTNSMIQDLKAFAQETQQLMQQTQAATQLATTAASMIQHPSLGAVMGLANTVGIENPLPISPYAVMGLTSGYGGMNSVGGIVGKLNGLGSLVTTSYSTDRVYTCTTDSFACQEQQQRAAANAGLKGISAQIYGELAAHVPVLQGLRAQAATATDPAQRENIMVQLQVENSWAANAGQQLQSAVAMASAQENVQRQREDEHLSQSVRAVINAAPK